MRKIDLSIDCSHNSEANYANSIRALHGFMTAAKVLGLAIQKLQGCSLLKKCIFAIAFQSEAGPIPDLDCASCGFAISDYQPLISMFV